MIKIRRRTKASLAKWMRIIVCRPIFFYFDVIVGQSVSNVNREIQRDRDKYRNARNCALSRRTTLLIAARYAVKPIHWSYVPTGTRASTHRRCSRLRRKQHIAIQRNPNWAVFIHFLQSIVYFNHRYAH